MSLTARSFSKHFTDEELSDLESKTFVIRAELLNGDEIEREIEIIITADVLPKAASLLNALYPGQRFQSVTMEEW